ncbi:leucine-rich repeat protein [Prevotella falsenii]|uniref:leucine-rich repeat protein n=1 Tax=Prevotella falsenii TaxID=515414 RepID=UPI001E5FE8A7|nr:leucine-rich repeat protein [Prevotella falsenii]
MKQKLFTIRNFKGFIALVCMLLSTSVAFAQKTVHVEEAGTLKDKLSDEEMLSLTELTLTGNLNGTDILFIRAMGGSTIAGGITDGKLQVLDLSGANIVAGGDAYYYVDEDLEYGTKDNTLSVNMFCRCGQLRKITMPNSVTSVEKNAFLLCDNLTDIIAKPENKNFKTADGVLFDKDMTTLLKCPDGKTGTYNIPEGTLKLSDEAFSNTEKLEKLVIPASLNNIGSNSAVPFYICNAMKSFEVHKDNKTFASVDGVLFDKKIETLLKYPKGRSGEYVVPETVKKIGKYSFYEATELAKVTLPKSLSEIESSAFAHIKKLTTLTLPENLEQIGFGVFMNCTGLTEIHALAAVPPYCGTMAFYNVDFDHCKLFVPHGKANDYRMTTPWSSFKHIEEAAEKAYVTFTTGKDVGSEVIFRIVGEDMTFDGIKFLKTEEILGEKFDYYQVTKKDVRIEGNIAEMSVDNFEVEALDVSHCPMLKVLSCKNGKLAKLDLSNNKELDSLNCSYCGLTELDLTQCGKLTFVDCDENKITKLDVSKNLLLSYLSANKNQIGSIDVSAQKYLETLSLNGAGIATLDIRNNPYLQNMYVNENKLAELDLTKNTNIQELQLAKNNFTSFSLNSSTLKKLYINDNKLKSMTLDLPELELLCAYNNEMAELDLSKLKNVNTLSLHHNLLSDVNLKPLEELEYIWIDNNKLKSLDLSQNQMILTVVCYSNELAANACKSLMEGLPQRNESDIAEIIIVDTKGTEGNVCTKSAVAIAKAKQ